MFLRRVWRDGALFGATPDEAFFVKCDEENNPPENRDAGILTVEIGIAPVKPAEFVVFRISQFSGGAGLEGIQERQVAAWPDSTDALTAARFSITIDGYEIASFSELQGITTEVETSTSSSPATKGDHPRSCPASRTWPTVTLQAGQDPGIEHVGLARGRPHRRHGPAPARAARS